MSGGVGEADEAAPRTSRRTAAGSPGSDRRKQASGSARYAVTLRSYCAATRSAARSSFSASAIRNASSRLCEAFRRGSQWVW
jgi:hypothetical protein